MTREPPRDSETLALAALAATLGDDRRAARFLDLTGLSPDGIRERLGERGLLASCLAFLEAHEPDLIAVAGDLAVKPEALVAARADLEA
jgi:3',5'-cyclic AMP phosphodiesterase CpdA